ncbi:site-specific DNA-methyltransferase [Skermanella sp. TT6]|uniref:Methyltransferase n=1 Tax=Skermanella cutis TaxID=2775420 RepID=A0ABX7B705_9PROT|nr:site-specific DNA-methyltransferase [Skermanella sp. TT6]QQP90160.1 site-specific DNA-methyltransferase [Skermanella sp. TT6]
MIDELGSVAIGRFLQGDALCQLRNLPHETINLVVSSPPYNIGKVYEKKDPLTMPQYLEWQNEIIEAVARCVTPDGSICWQVGTYVNNGEIVPLDVVFYNSFKKHGLKLRNRIIWRYNFGHNADRRFSGRYETILWFTKSDNYKFNLDPVRVPQIYPGKRHAKAKTTKAGSPSGNPLGKNPSDYWEFSAERDFIDNPVWDIPNVKHNHPEKTVHPCQFPIELVERCVLALTEKNNVVLDPFVGTGATVLAAVKHQRNGIGIDKDENFLRIAQDRLNQLHCGKLAMRQLGQPIWQPTLTEKLARIPEEWKQ